MKVVGSVLVKGGCGPLEQKVVKINPSKISTNAKIKQTNVAGYSVDSDWQ